MSAKVTKVAKLPPEKIEYEHVQAYAAGFNAGYEKGMWEALSTLISFQENDGSEISDRWHDLIAEATEGDVCRASTIDGVLYFQWENRLVVIKKGKSSAKVSTNHYDNVREETLKAGDPYDHGVIDVVRRISQWLR